MDSSDGLLCLSDIRSMRLTVNEIRKWIKDVCPKPEVIFPQPLIHLPISDQESTTAKTSMGFLVQPSTELWVPTSTHTPTTTTMSQMMTGQLVPHSGQGMYDVADQTPDLEALLTLCVASLAVWLGLVMLALTWMRLTDLNYQPSVVSLKSFLYNLVRDMLIFLTSVSLFQLSFNQC